MNFLQRAVNKAYLKQSKLKQLLKPQDIKTEELHVYAVFCTWHGPIAKTSTTKPKEVSGFAYPGIPCCPHCGSVLYQIEEKKFWDGAIDFEKSGKTNYVEYLKWLEEQPVCYKDHHIASAAFQQATGKEVIWK